MSLERRREPVARKLKPRVKQQILLNFMSLALGLSPRGEILSVPNGIPCRPSLSKSLSAIFQEQRGNF